MLPPDACDSGCPPSSAAPRARQLASARRKVPRGARAAWWGGKRLGLGLILARYRAKPLEPLEPLEPLDPFGSNRFVSKLSCNCHAIPFAFHENNLNNLNSLNAKAVMHSFAGTLPQVLTLVVALCSLLKMCDGTREGGELSSVWHWIGTQSGKMLGG